MRFKCSECKNDCYEALINKFICVNEDCKMKNIIQSDENDG